MKAKIIPSNWIYSEKIRRMDCTPFLSGAIEVREILKKSSLRKELLPKLTAGHDGGIYNGPHFRRIYLSSKENSVPFLTSSSILEFDLSFQPRLRKKDAVSRKLSYLEIKPGMTLISCSGTIGKTAYARPEMEGMWSSQDILKVVPNSEKIPPGYLFAYLKSSYGIPLLISGTYGTIIQHLEPEHLFDLPVARLERKIENEIHKLIEDSARLRSNCTQKIHTASKRLLEITNLLDIEEMITEDYFRNIGSVSNINQNSLRAWNYLPEILNLMQLIPKKSPNVVELGKLVKAGTLTSGPRFKRIDAEGEFAIPLIGQREIFNLTPEGRLISRQYLPKNFSIVVPSSTILIAAQGSMGWYDTFAHAQFIYGRFSNFAFSQHFIRVMVNELKIAPEVLFAYIRSKIGFCLLRGCADGSMQQDFHPQLISRIPVPIIEDKDAVNTIVNLIQEAYSGFDEAYEKEQQAIRMVEQAIKEAA